MVAALPGVGPPSWAWGPFAEGGIPKPPCFKSWNWRGAGASRLGFWGGRCSFPPVSCSGWPTPLLGSTYVPHRLLTANRPHRLPTPTDHIGCQPTDLKQCALKQRRAAQRRRGNVLFVFLLGSVALFCWGAWGARFALGTPTVGYWGPTKVMWRGCPGNFRAALPFGSSLYTLWF